MNVRVWNRRGNRSELYAGIARFTGNGPGLGYTLTAFDGWVIHLIGFVCGRVEVDSDGCWP